MRGEGVNMAEEVKEVEVVDEKKDDKKEEKKENGFKKFFKNIGKNISDSSRESKLEKLYNDKAELTFEVFKEGAAFGMGSGNIKGKFIDETHIEIYGDAKKEDYPYSAILVIEPKDKDKELPKFYYITNVKHEEKDTVTLKLTEKVDDKEVENEYTRPVSILTLDSSVKEVRVIKAHDKYFLKLDETK